MFLSDVNVNFKIKILLTEVSGDARGILETLKKIRILMKKILILRIDF